MKDVGYFADAASLDAGPGRKTRSTILCMSQPWRRSTRGRASATPIRYCSLATKLRLGGRTWRVNRSRLQGLRVDRGADYGAGLS
jgi:hypothetical protein